MDHLGNNDKKKISMCSVYIFFPQTILIGSWLNLWVPNPQVQKADYIVLPISANLLKWQID